MSGLTKASTHVLDWVYQCEHSPATGLGLAVSSSCNQTRSACRPGFFAHMPDNVLEDWQGVDQAWQRALESWLLCIEDRAHGKRSRETTSLAASKRVFSVGAVGVRLALFFYLFLICFYVFCLCGWVRWERQRVFSSSFRSGLGVRVPRNAVMMHQKAPRGSPVFVFGVFRLSWFWGWWQVYEAVFLETRCFCGAVWAQKTTAAAAAAAAWLLKQWKNLWVYLSIYPCLSISSISLSWVLHKLTYYTTTLSPSLSVPCHSFLVSTHNAGFESVTLLSHTHMTNK